ncbi:hypothetical protein [Methylophilus sp. 5]|uniref:hypothetical protein n=1 Tax=Methylophilus sp. 5 TaxID=1112274 RepID=UPI0004913361|nr:hypothetical protein [Methylophilus sp. 5]
MNKLLITLLFSMTALAANAASSRDDAATLGTSDSPQVQRQQRSTDKGPTGVHQDGVPHDESNLGNAHSPQVQEQNKRTDKGLGERPEKKHRNKLLRNKDDKAGTTQGNPVQPTVPEAAPPATTN